MTLPAYSNQFSKILRFQLVAPGGLGVMAQPTPERKQCAACGVRYRAGRFGAHTVVGVFSPKERGA